MSCAHPILALDKGFKLNDDGKKVRDIKILDMTCKNYEKGLEEMKEKYGDNLLLLPCGKCYSCAIDYSRMWSARIMSETKDHRSNCFITLTYNEFCCPERPSKYDFQKFIKRLRKAVKSPIRYFGCGEVGEVSSIRDGVGRPHYHAIIFGYDFPDKVELKRGKSGFMIYTSKLLEELWPFGISCIGEVTPQSAQYCAKYSVKRKMSGMDAGEFVLMSRRPGIGASHYKDIDWSSGKLYIEGKTFKIPRFYEKLAEADNNFLAFISKENRKEIGKSLTSKKYQWNLSREEEALVKANNYAIVQSVRRYHL